MSNESWLLFSFTLPARNQAGRMRLWRRLTGLGAVIVKSAFYALPALPALREQMAWLCKETEDLGGEALYLESGPPATMAPGQMAALFTAARDADWQALEDEARPLLERSRSLAVTLGQDEGSPRDRVTDPGAQRAAALHRELEGQLRKLLKRAEAQREIDYFPSGRGQAVAALLEEIGQALSGEAERPDPALPRLDPADYQGLTWLTRQDPYVDRLASFWLVRRFIDPGARIAFLPDPPGEGALSSVGDRRTDCAQASRPQSGPPIKGTSRRTVRFDMDQAEFTHVGPLTTFEVLRASFGLEERLPERLRRVVRAIDLSEVQSGPPETAGVKRLLDGLCLTASGDDQRVQSALALFDALLASYTNEQPNTGEKQ